MKTQNKVRILMIAVVCLILLVFAGYQYLNGRGEKLYLISKQASDKQVIDQVLEFKTESLLKPTKDNSAWDDMVAFAKERDLSWGKENLVSIQTTFGMSGMSVYDTRGNVLIAINEPDGSNLLLSKAQIKQLFSGTNTCHSFLRVQGKLYEIFGASIVPTIDVYRKTEANGFLVSTKEWDKDYVSELQKATGFDLKILAATDKPDTSNIEEEEVLLRNLKDYNNENVAVLKFSRKNYLAADLSNMQVMLIIGINILMVFIGILFILTKKWITLPLKKINESLLSGETHTIKKYLSKHDEFGRISNLISQYNLQKDDLVKEINDKVIAEKALTESKDFAEMIYKVSPSAIFTIDANGIITSWNCKAENITGFPASEIIGKSCLEFADMPCKSGCGLYDQEINKPYNAKECTIINKSGEKISISKNVDVLKDSNGNIIGGIESFEDITLWKKAEQLMQHAKDDAEKTAVMKSDFLAMMSHEIRTPVNGVIGMTELLLTTRLNRTQREYMKGVQTSAYSLLETVNSILDFSKIEAGKLEIEKEEFNIREVIERSVDILNVQAFIKNIELLYEVEPSLPDFFIGDSVRIRQILINLISNALKFTEKGEIFISVKSKTGVFDSNNITIIQFSVKDTGIGIADDRKNSIFDAFAQAEISTTRKYGGTGLGLSISRQLTELMNGSIAVESVVNEGSTFTFEIPLEISGNQLASNFSEIRNIKRVMLVDDNITNLKIMHDMLKYWGIMSVMATDGNMALDFLRQSKESDNLFDLVVLDMHMPEMDGLTVAGKIKAELNLPSEPVILMLSSIEKDNIKEMAEKKGIDCYLTKPVKMKDFYELLLQANDINKDSKKEVEKHCDVVKDEMKDILKHRTILITDDNKINLELLKALLSETGAKIHTAGNGAEAIELFKSKNPELVFMDVNMPVMNGFEATKMIRYMESNEKHTPIIALTAVAMQGDREKCLSMGMDGYMSKPFLPKDLYSIIRKYLINGQKVKIAENVPVIPVNNETYNKEEFISLMGIDNELYIDIISDFKRLFPEYYQKLRESIKAADFEQVDFYAHTIKGMCGNIRARNLSNIAWRIEVMSKTPDLLEEIEVCSVQLKNAYHELLPYLEEK
jgi:PAS domain S-box-containing protein